MNKFRRLGLLAKTLVTELFRNPVIINASLTIGYDGKPIPSNWGDDINYWFLREISKRPVVIYNQSVLARLLKKKHILGIGSILGMFSTSESIVWGSGILSDNVNEIPRPIEIKAVRGPLTRQRLLEKGIECKEIYGDPAMLVKLTYDPAIEKKCRLGIIPQYPQMAQAKREIGERSDVQYIDIAHYGHWHDFIDRIKECDFIASSSLHGLIMAEAYGIPSVWVKFSTNEDSHDIKYRDFYGSLGKEGHPFIINGHASPDDLMSACSCWKPGVIDLDQLVKAAPFPTTLDKSVRKH